MTGQAEYTHSLFISYAEADRAWVEGYLVDALEAASVRVHSEEAFQLGVPRLLEFERAIQNSQRTLLILSPAYLAEGFSQFTDLLAQSYGLETATWPVIPLILHPVQLPPRLAMLTALNATDPDAWPEVLERLLADLQRPIPQPPAKPTCPYPGMVPFSEADSDRFFGRDDETQEILERLRLYPFLTVIGPSGSGKSSLVFAGLIPALRKSSFLGPGEWLVRRLRPGENPVSALRATIGDVIDLDTFQPSNGQSDRLLLVVDQFEEAFTLAGDETVPFQEALLQLIQTHNTYVIFTVRADFYPDLMTSPLWPEIQAHRLEVLPLGEHGLRQAIVRPAEDTGVFVEAALVERLVADAAGEPGILPLVQETMVLLWERVERRFLALRAYEALVLPRHAYGAPPLTGLQVAMARRADAALAVLTAEQQAIARRIFLRLIQFGEGRADTRRQQRAAALRSAGDDPDRFEETLRHLADNRLLTLSGEEEGAARQVDISHEALISGWPTLGGWLAERREAEQTRRRLEDKAAEWERLGRGSGGLLDEVELVEAGRWLASPDAADLGYGEALPALVEASRMTIEEAEREKEAARQRELAQAKALAEEQERRAEAERQRAEEQQRRAEAQARDARRLLRLVIALAVVFLLAVGAAVFAAVKQQEAREQTRLAEQQTRLSQSGQLAAQSQAVLGDYPQRSLLLALEAFRALAADDPPNPSAEQALRDALGRAGGLSLRGHSGAVVSAAFSSDGHWLATTSRDDTIRLWDVSALAGQDSGGDSAASAVQVLRGHSDDVMSVAFSPDNRWLATGSVDSTIRLWDIAPLLQADSANQELVTAPLVLHGHEDVVTTVCFSPDGRWLASGSWDTTVRLWEVSTVLNTDPGSADLSSATYVLRDHDGQVLSAAFSPEGRWLATAGDDDTIRLWDVSALSDSGGGDDNVPTIAQALHGHGADVSSVAFSPNGRWLASGSEDNTARVWDVSALLNPNTSNTGPVEPLVLRGHMAWVTSVAFSRDGRWLATGSDDGTARLWDLQARDPTGEPRTLHGHEAPVPTVAFSPDGHWLVTGSGDHTARLWDVSALLNTDLAAEHLTAEPLVLRGHGAQVWAVAFSPDGQRLATATDDGTAWLWDVSTGEVSMLSGHMGKISSLAFSPDGRWLATGGLDRNLGLWDVVAILSGMDSSEMDRAAEPALLHSFESGVTALAFSRDGRWLATGGDDSAVRLFDFPALLGGDAQTRAGAVAAFTLQGHANRITSLAFSPDDRWLASSSWDQTVRLWNVFALVGGEAPASVETAILRSDDGPITSVAFSPDGHWLATGGGKWDTTVRLWDVTAQLTAGNQGQEQPAAFRVLHGHASAITAVAFSPDGRRLASGSMDGTARLWDALTVLDTSQAAQDAAVEPVVLQSHGDGVTSLAFSPDGSWLVTGSLDNTARVWRSALEDLKPVACRVAGRNLTQEEWEQYFRGQPYRATCEDWPVHPSVTGTPLDDG